MGANEEQLQLQLQSEQRALAAREFMGALQVGLAVLSARLLSLLALVGAGALFGVAVAMPDTIRTVVAGLYAAFVLFPVLWINRRSE